MTEEQQRFLDYIKKYVGQPYVWGGSGQTVTKSNYISTINKMETSGGYGIISYKKAATDFCEKLFAKGMTELKIFDCSGYISKALISAGLLSRRRDCDGLWSKCKRTTELRDFNLLFRVNSSNKEDETHIGVYYNGKQYHAKGRKYGVVCEPYKKSYWHKMGVYPGLGTEKALSVHANESNYIFTKLLKSPMTNSQDVRELKKLLIAKGYTQGITASNGNFYASTKKVVKQFQKDHGLEVDGIAGKNTITALGGVWR